jgi:hypothetical protein
MWDAVQLTDTLLAGMLEAASERSLLAKLREIMSIRS